MDRVGQAAPAGAIRRQRSLVLLSRIKRAQALDVLHGHGGPDLTAMARENDAPTDLRTRGTVTFDDVGLYAE